MSLSGSLFQSPLLDKRKGTFGILISFALQSCFLAASSLWGLFFFRFGAARLVRCVESGVWNLKAVEMNFPFFDFYLSVLINLFCFSILLPRCFCLSLLISISVSEYFTAVSISMHKTVTKIFVYSFFILYVDTNWIDYSITNSWVSVSFFTYLHVNCNPYD